MTLSALLALAMLVMRLFPATPAARWLHLHLVKLPLALAGRVERKHVWFAAMGLVFLYGAALTLPADLALIAAWDFTTYVDVVAAVYASAILIRVKAAAAAIRARLPRLRRTRRPQQPARARRPLQRRRATPANDDNEDRPAILARCAAA